MHHHLIRCGLRTSVGLVVETGEAHEVHQFATLAGYGAEAINPYLAFETIEAMLPDFDEELTAEEAVKRYIKATDKGILKVMSKMGISTYQSYCGAQIFDAIGLRSDFIAKYFTGTNSQVEGIGLEEIARETVERHSLAFSDAACACARRSRSAANMPIAFAAKRICGGRRWSPICSMRYADSCPRNTGHSRERSTNRPSSF